MHLYEFFKPDKKKIFLTIILAVVFYLIAIFLPQADFFGGLIKKDYREGIIYLILNWLITAIFYYPLSCAAISIRKSLSGNKRHEKKNIAPAIILILIFNPFTLGFAYEKIDGIYYNLYYYPCGIQVMDFPENSALRNAGIHAGEVIIYVEGEKVDDIPSLMGIVQYKKPGDILEVTTDMGPYQVVALQYPNNERDMAYLGGFFQDKACKK